MKRLFKALAVILAAGAAWATMRSTPFAGPSLGVIDHISPLLRPDQAASAIVNIWLDDRGTLTTRNGYVKNNSAVLSNASSYVNGMGYHIAASGNSFFAVVAGSNVYTTANSFGGSYTNATGALTITNAASNHAQSTSFNNFRVFANETDAPFKVPTTGGAATVMAGAPQAAKTVATYGNYLILGNTTEGGTAYPTRIRWSDINTTETWPANNYWDVENNDGDYIVAIKAFADSVYIFKRHSIHRLLITGLAGADAFIVRPVARGIGCWSKMSVQVAPSPSMYHESILMFQGADGVYTATPWYGGLAIKKVSDKIQNQFYAINPAQVANSVAAVYPRRNQYWLAVATGTATSNTAVLVYDYLQDAWSTYNGMNVNAIGSAIDTNGNSLLFTGDQTGNVYEQDSGSTDNPGGVSTAITASYTTNDMSFDRPELTKGFKYLYLFASQSSSVTLNVSAYYDFSPTAETSQSVTFGQAGAAWGTAIWGTDFWPGSTVTTYRMELNRYARQVRFQFSNTGQLGIMGWALVYDDGNGEDWRDSND